ncbi:hypothetical protein POX_a01457 [Penicillium oxalicum]|uniref:hypothetical protein n=1 Tax=Penicillium oxalicum TaxID=69781 RepID=UPI0020B7C58D|nr:hypothetical protein POX_a01457 [Penicillium oxalicum]KAI2794856.1 hypothetical protein POX_a01457 [Penicillium oxalicum]
MTLWISQSWLNHQVRVDFVPNAWGGGGKAQAESKNQMTQAVGPEDKDAGLDKTEEQKKTKWKCCGDGDSSRTGSSGRLPVTFLSNLGVFDYVKYCACNLFRSEKISGGLRVRGGLESEKDDDRHTWREGGQEWGGAKTARESTIAQLKSDGKGLG